MIVLPKHLNLKRSQLSIQRLIGRYFWLDQGILHISLLSLCAFLGTLRLGIAFDDYIVLWFRHFFPVEYFMYSSVWNRSPVNFFIVQAYLYSVPFWLAHLTIISVHTIVAVLIYKILNQFNLKGVSLSSAILFLIWPAHAEALHWVIASAVAFGVCCVLSAVLLFFNKRYIFATLIAFVGYTFNESILFPGLFLQLVATLRSRLAWWQRGLYIGTQVVLYALFQLGRILLTGPNIAPYNAGLSNVKQNALDLFFMSLGLASSRDVTWMWSKSPDVRWMGFITKPADVTQLLPWWFFVLALLVAGLFIYMLTRQKYLSPLNLRLAGLGAGISLVGYVSAFLIFLIVAGNFMNTRYTYTAIPYLCFFIALVLNALTHQRKQFFRIAGQLLTIFIIGWALFLTWSNIEANYYPAWQVSQRIQADVARTYQETGIKRIHLVNEPRVVGNAYAVRGDYAYRSMAKFYINPELEVTAEALPDFIEAATKEAASTDQAEIATVVQGGRITFSEHPCIFLGWQDGERVVTSLAYTPDRQFLLNCQTGLVEPSREAEGALEYKYHRLASKDFLRDFYPDPLLP